MNTYAKQIPQQGAHITQQKELSPDTTERLKLICTTFCNVLHLEVATFDVAAKLLQHMTSEIGLQIVGANKIYVNIPTEAPATANLVNIRSPFQCTILGCNKHLNKTMRAARDANPFWKDPPFCSWHFRDNHSNTPVDQAAVDNTEEEEDHTAAVTEEPGDLNGAVEVTRHDHEEHDGDTSAGTSDSASSVSAPADTDAWTAEEVVCLIASAALHPSGGIRVSTYTCTACHRASKEDTNNIIK